jgi:hypothetical protein
MHSSLKTKTNLRLLIVWTVALLAVAALAAPPWVSMMVGAVLGTVSATLQLRALHEAADRLIQTTTLLEVRQALASSSWGKWYLRAFLGEPSDDSGGIHRLVSFRIPSGDGGRLSGICHLPRTADLAGHPIPGASRHHGIVWR